MGWNDGRLSPQSSLLSDEGSENVKRSVVDLGSGSKSTGAEYVPPSLLIPDLEVNERSEKEVTAAAIPSGSSTDELQKWNLFFMEKAAIAGSYCQEKSKMLRARAQKGPLPLSVFAFLGGSAVVLTNFFALFHGLFHLSLIGILMSAYCLVFGLTVCLLEGKMWSTPTAPLPILFENAKFLKYVWGRGAFYIFVGTMQFFKRSPVDMLVGGFLGVIGLILLIDGRIAAQKLSAVSLPSKSALIAIFKANDGDNDGFLEYNEFGLLLKALGVELSAYELEVACTAVDQDDDERISEQELVKWWESFHGAPLPSASTSVMV